MSIRQAGIKVAEHPWFYVPNLGTSTVVSFDATQYRHARVVLRLKVGNQITLFDGNGVVADGKIVDIHSGRKSFSATVKEIHRLTRKRRTVLATALPKAKRLHTLIDMATQLGVSKIAPILWQHGQTGQSLGREKIQSWMLSACKQSRNPFLPSLTQPLKINDFLEMENYQNLPICYGTTDESQSHRSYRSAGIFQQETMILVVGPEGGMSADEISLLIANGAVGVRIGSNILRIETAACGLLALRAAY